MPGDRPASHPMRCIVSDALAGPCGSPAKTSSTSSGVNSCRSIWRMLSSSHSKPETTTEPSYQFVYTKRYKARGLNRYGDNSWAQRFPWGKPWDRQPISGKLRLKLVSVPGLRRIAACLPKTAKHPRRTRRRLPGNLLRQFFHDISETREADLVVCQDPAIVEHCEHGVGGGRVLRLAV